ncbi:MAG TPA: GNAT family N-acetyltransferase [Desulfomonilaceae bacterium]|nr:GNAT family N-acetyltransferase [Desulfomonilaceae bacterium]
MVGTEQNIYHDKFDRPFFVSCCGPADFFRILDMYDSFMPEAVAQGLPPTNKATRHAWIRTLLESGENYAAIIEGKVVAHAALLPNRETSGGEYVIFVAGPYRKRGLGTVLTETAVQRAKELGLQSVWLTVESNNFTAIKLYKKTGFQFCNEGLSERKMILGI